MTNEQRMREVAENFIVNEFGRNKSTNAKIDRLQNLLTSLPIARDEVAVKLLERVYTQLLAELKNTTYFALGETMDVVEETRNYLSAQGENLGGNSSNSGVDGHAVCDQSHGQPDGSQTRAGESGALQSSPIPEGPKLDSENQASPVATPPTTLMEAVNQLFATKTDEQIRADWEAGGYAKYADCTSREIIGDQPPTTPAERVKCTNPACIDGTSHGIASEIEGNYKFSEQCPTCHGTGYLEPKRDEGEK